MESVSLEPLGRSHLEGLAAIIRDPDVLRWTRIPDPPPEGFAESWVARYEAGRADGTAEAFAIVDGDGAFLGVAVAPEIQRGARQGELGYVIAPQARGRGVATRALELLTAWAFAEAGLLRATLLIATDNHASKTVAARNGYVREGVLRSLWFKQDQRTDTEIWSRVAGDPPVSAARA